MNKNLNTLLMVAALILAPVLGKSQWSAVRFDSANIFRLNYAVTANDVFHIGTGPTTGEYFLLRTDDGGVTWDSIGLNTANDQFQVVKLHFPDVNNGFIGGRKNNAVQNLQKTTDNGDTWTDITPDPQNIQAINALFFLNSQQGWASSGQDFYTTTNAGANWNTSTLTFIPSDFYFTDALNGFATGQDATTYQAVMMKTNDGGLTWTPLLSRTDPNVFVNTFSFVNPVDNNTIFTSQEWTNKLFRTLDGGATWDTITCDSVWQIVDFHFESADSGHVLSSMGQLYYTNDGGATWNLAYTAEWGLYGPSVLFYSLTFAEGVGYVCGSSGLIKRFDLNISGIHAPLVETGKLEVYPNPCYGAQNVTLASEGMSGDCVVRIMNTLGEVVYFENIQHIESRARVELNCDNLAAGTYMVVLSNDSQKQTSKLIIAE